MSDIKYIYVCIVRVNVCNGVYCLCEFLHIYTPLSFKRRQQEKSHKIQISRQHMVNKIIVIFGKIYDCNKIFVSIITFSHVINTKKKIKKQRQN